MPGTLLAALCAQSNQMYPDGRPRSKVYLPIALCEGQFVGGKTQAVPYKESCTVPFTHMVKLADLPGHAAPGGHRRQRPFDKYWPALQVVNGFMQSPVSLLKT